MAVVEQEGSTVTSNRKRNRETVLGSKRNNLVWQLRIAHYQTWSPYG
jgi:hypothetical protein